jgi:hypothetical protein
MVESHRLTFNLGEPFVVNRLNDHPANAVFNPEVSLVLVAVGLVLRNLSFTNDFVRVDSCWIRTWVGWNDLSGTRSGEGDVLCVIDHHANMAMLFASISGCDAASGIGELFDDQI